MNIHYFNLLYKCPYNSYEREIPSVVTQSFSSPNHLTATASPMSKEEINDVNRFHPKSSFLQLAEYDSQGRVMTLTFTTGSQYKYLNVFESTWLNFKQSSDHSSYYARGIKGRIQSVPIVKKVIGKPHKTPLKDEPIQRSLSSNGNITNAGSRANLKRRGLIPDSLR